MSVLKKKKLNKDGKNKISLTLSKTLTQTDTVRSNKIPTIEHLSDEC